MDVDINRPLGGDLQAHDELDFDMDMVDDPYQAASNHGQSPKDINLIEAMDKDMREVESITNQEAHSSNDIIGEDVDIDVDVVDAEPDSERNNDGMMEEFSIETHQIGEIDASGEHAQQNQVVSQAWTVIEDKPHAVEEDHVDTHEIDYEIEDLDPQQASIQNQDISDITAQDAAVVGNSVEAQGDSEPAPAVGDIASNNLEAGTTTGSMDGSEQIEVVEEGPHQETQHEETRRSNEVDYEQPEAAAEGDPEEQFDHVENSAVDQKQEQAQTGEDDTQDSKQVESDSNQLHSEAPNDANLEDAEDLQVEVNREEKEEIYHDGEDADAEEPAAEYGEHGEERENGDEEHEDEHEGGFELVNEEDVDGSVTERQPDEQSAPDFPDITVQYKGDEYPFFSTTSSGFFRETYVLDEAMDKILTGFREELANELAQEDELVFQVDELGLEFTEV